MTLSSQSALSQISYVPPIPAPAGSEPTRSDFNSDGRFDLLWQNEQTGQLSAWHVNAATILSSRALIPSAVPLEWKLRGSGDLNADGKADRVFQNTITGEIAFYLMNGVLSYATGFLTPNRIDPEWQLASVRDMDRDGRPDMVWNNVTTGQVLAWYMNGTGIIRQGWLNSDGVSDTNWRLRGTADFDGDGCADLLWQQSQPGSRSSGGWSTAGLWRVSA